MAPSSHDPPQKSDEEKRRSVKAAFASRFGFKKKSSLELNVPSKYFRFDQYPEYQELKQKLDIGVKLQIRNPFFAVHEQVSTEKTVIEGKICDNYACYNYLGMSGDPTVSQAAKEAIDNYGTSASSSRIQAGGIPLHRELEMIIAEMIGVDDCHIFVAGFSTNVTTIGHLFGPKDLILYDALSHNSVIQGCILSGARRLSFPHSDWATLEELLKAERTDYERVLIVVEGVYGMDGDIPDLPGLIEIKKKYKTFLMIDEAHSMGTIGQRGCGIREYFNIDPHDVDIWMGTLSKSFASCGGYIAGDPALIEYLKYTVPGSVYSVGLSPPDTASALAAIRLMLAEPERVDTLHKNAQLFLDLAKAKGLDTGLSHDTPVIPIIVRSSLQTVRMAQALFEQNIIAQPVLPPGVEENATRLRFFVTSLHTEDQISRTIDRIADIFHKI